MVTIALFIVAGLLYGCWVFRSDAKIKSGVMTCVFSFGVLGFVVAIFGGGCAPTSLEFEKKNEQVLYPLYDRLSGKGPFFVEKRDREYIVVYKTLGDDLPPSIARFNPANTTIEEIEGEQGMLERYMGKLESPWHLIFLDWLIDYKYKLLVPKNSINNKTPD